MTLGSLFDGLGGWQRAAVKAGIKPLWSSEIDEFCKSVTRILFEPASLSGDIAPSKESQQATLERITAVVQDYYSDRLNNLSTR